MKTEESKKVLFCWGRCISFIVYMKNQANAVKTGFSDLLKRKILWGFVFSFSFLLAIYPAFADLSDADRAVDTARFDTIDSQGPVSEYQIRSRSSDYKTDRGGLCNVSAITTLLNRRLAADYISGSFSVADVFKSLGCKNYKTDGKLYSDKAFGQDSSSLKFQYWYKEGDTGHWCVNNTKYTTGSYSYTVKQISGSTVRKATTKDGFNAYIAGLLHQHPEGIAIRNTKANHVAVIYKYTYANGVYTLYVKDPVGNTSGKMENSYIYKQSGKDLYTNLDFLVYINGTAAVSLYEQEAPQSIGLDATALSVNLSGNVTISASVFPLNSNPSIVWHSSNENVATISGNGIVVPHSVGETIITATSAMDYSVSANCQVTVFYQDSDSAKSLLFNGIKYPHQYVKGSTYSWSGSVESDVDLQSVTVSFYADKEYTYNASIAPGTKSFNMSEVGSAILKQLPLGPFTFSIIASDVVNRKIGFSNSSSTVVSSGSNTSWECKNTFSRPILLGTGERNGHRYEVYQCTSKMWDYDRDFAYEKGGHLVYIEDEDENVYVCNLCKDVGATYVYTGGFFNGSSWQWLDGTSVNYTAWRSINIPNATYLYPTVIGLAKAEEHLWGRPPRNEYSYFAVEYDPVQVTDIVIEAETEVVVGESIAVEAFVYPENAYINGIELISSDPSIATVNNQSKTITGVNEGWVTITARAIDGSGIQRCFDLWVQHQTIHPYSIKLYASEYLYISEDTIQMQVGSSTDLYTNFMPDNTDDQSVVYYSSDESVVSIEEYSSTILAISAGTCEIIVVSNDGGFESRLTVNVVPATGICGESVTWAFSDGVLAISGTGEMYDYRIAYSTPWVSMLDNITSVIIDEGVTSVGRNAFGNCINVTDISLPNSLTSLGANAFYHCESLVNISIPSSVNQIGDAAFAYCMSLTDITIPYGVVSVGEYVFSYCTALEEIVIPETVTSLVYCSFSHCDSLREITIPSKVTNIGYGTFAVCANLTSVYVPATVTEIGEDVFARSENVTIYCIDGSVAHTYAVDNSIPYILIDVGAGRTITDGDYYICSSVKPKIILDVQGTAVPAANGTTVALCDYGEYEFCDYDMWTVTYLNNGFYSIKQYGTEMALSVVDNSTTKGADIQVSIFNGGTGQQWAIESTPYGYRLRARCSGLSADIAGGVDYIRDGTNVAQWSQNEGEKAQNQSWSFAAYGGECGENATWSYSNGTLIISGSGSMYDYEQVPDPWRTTAPWGSKVNTLVINEGITSVGRFAFYFCNNLTSVSLPTTLKSIGTSAFQYCSGLTAFNVPEGVESIGITAFAWCDALQRVTIPASVRFIDDGAFCYCHALSTISVASGNHNYRVVDDVLFSNDGVLVAYPITKTDSIYVIPDTTTRIGSFAFAGCDNLISIRIPGTVTTVSDCAFDGADYITILCFDGSAAHTYAANHNIPYTIIGGACGENAVWEYDGGTLTVSGTGEMYDFSAYSAPWYPYAANMDTVVVETGITGISRFAFINCQMESISLPESLQHIGEGAFTDCGNLSSIIIPVCSSYLHQWALSENRSITVLAHTDTLTAHAKEDSTCTETGTEAYWSCDVCGKLFSDAETKNEITAPTVIAAKGHTLITHAKVDSTCAETGTEAYWSCDSCGKIFSDAEARNEIDMPVEIEMKGHKLSTHPKVDATCTETGTQIYWNCSVCGKLFSDAQAINEIAEPVVIPAKGHTLTAHAKVDATCTENGTEAYWSCGICGELFSDAEAQNGIEEPAVIAAAGHMLTEHAEVDSTCTETGTEKYWSCNNCGRLYSDSKAETEIAAPIVIGAKGHDWGEATYTWNADNSKVTAVRICGRDGTHQETETANTTAEITKQPTFEEFGETTYTAVFRNTAFVTQTKTEANIPKRDYEWEAPVYTWSDDNSEVTARRISRADASIEQTETVETTSEVSREATCTEKGETTYTSLAFTNAAFEVQIKTVDDIPMKAHTLISHKKVDSTCTETGTKAYWSCSDCGKLFSDSRGLNEIAAPVVIAAKGHTLTAHEKIDSTCTETGTEAYWSCGTCGELFSDAEAKNRIDEPVEIAAKGHTLTAHAKVESTCTETGVEAYWSCDVCGKLFSDAETKNEIAEPVVIAAKGHRLTAYAGLDSTCTETGIEAYWSCGACGKLFSDSEGKNEIAEPVVIAAEGHKLTAHARVDSTCTDTGMEAYWSCDACCEMFSDAEANNRITAPAVIAPKGHDWDEPSYIWNADNSRVTATRICKRDGSHKETETVSTTAEITKQPTFEEFGETTYTAVFDSAAFTTQTKTEANIPKLNYDWEAPTYTWSFDYSRVTARRFSRTDTSVEQEETVGTSSRITREATCTEKGETTYTSAAFTNEAFEVQTKAVDNIPAKGHALTAHEKVDSTCSETGTEAYWSCGVCGKLFSDAGARNEIDKPVVIELKGHKLVTHAKVEATCTENGTNKYWSCKVCGKLFSDARAENEISRPVTIPAGHKLTAHEKVDATCTEPGVEEYWSCSACGLLFIDGNGRIEIDIPVEIEAKGHTEVTDPAVPPTETREGNAEWSHCSECGEEIREKVTIPALRNMNVLYLPSSLKQIEDEAFAGLGCQAVIIPDGCKTIGEYAFKDCRQLIYVLIPSSVDDYPENAFEGCMENLFVDRKTE